MRQRPVHGNYTKLCLPQDLQQEGGLRLQRGVQCSDKEVGTKWSEIYEDVTGLVTEISRIVQDCKTTLGKELELQVKMKQSQILGIYH